MKQKKDRTKSPLIRIAWVVFIIYCLIMIWELFLGNYRTIGIEYSRSANLIPFKTVWDYIIRHESYNAEIIFINLAANIIVFIPLGFFLPLLIKSFRKISIITALSFVIVLLAESLQYILNVGIFDVDDLILNTLGSMLGYMIFTVVNKRLIHHHICDENG
jgi:glycopeptide antibiotics resistance protein